jgi:hypothetical protein
MERITDFFSRRLALPDLSRLKISGPGKKSALGGAIAVAIFVALYYPIGMMMIHGVNDDIHYSPPESEVPKGASFSVAAVAGLIAREVETARWTANDPWFLPGSALDNMPNFQQGVISALARFAFELTDQIGRTRGSSQTDPDLQEAAGLLQYSGKKWVFDFSTSLAPTATSEAQYLKAQRSLSSFNKRLAAGNAVFDRRADNLLATLDRIALDLGSSSAALDNHIAVHGGSFFDFQADDVYYNVKGQLYGYTIVLREIARDFENVVAERELAKSWALMMKSFEHAASLDPLVIVNGSPDSQFAPSHLAAQGFYLLRARTQLREITNILLK